MGSALDRALVRVARQLDAEAKLRADLRATLAYPVLLVFMGVVTIAVMGAVVIPRFAVILADMGAALPASTRVLLSVSTGFQAAAPVLAVFGVGAIPFVRRWSARPASAARVDRWLLRLPVVGPVRHGFASARTCRALGQMLENGLPLLAALDASTEASGNHEVTRRIALARQRVARGARLTDALAEEAVVTPLALQLVGIGETSGRLGQLVSRAGELAEQRAERSLRVLVGFLEPLLVVGLGLLVAFVAAALLQAVYSVRPL
jgi:type II secretory pathway component PulF